ncbi:MAG TPA: nuclear transport factor 2 family protein [Lachnospiraceae bacterium]|nr:nuclear transport factor 2 family protein [Lachnospiraceae bacterium]
MNNMNREELIFEKEHDLWKAASNRNVAAYKELVADDAIMICGGYRCLGAEYAEYIRDFDISKYEIKNEEVIFSSKEAVQIHYVIDVKTELPETSDLGGVFHVISLWKMENNLWKLYFNIDSRIMTDNK